jgi:cyanophycinase-like exopeptidase
MCASRVREGGRRGWIIPVGGAEEKENSPQILRRFVDLAGGGDADIAVIPTASLVRETGPRYERIFGDMGARAAVSLGFDTRRDAEEPGRLARLTNRFIIDQHFRQRDRLGRLLSALAYNPFAVGIGLDEDTAAFIEPDNTVHVEGSGAITVIDAAEVQFSSMDNVQEGRPVCLLGVKLHILTKGATFNLHSRQADAGTLVQAKR